MKKLFLALVLAAPLAAYGQVWPAKPIRWVVPYTGGGITDTVTRVVTQKMQASLGQPIVVDNRPGANSIPGAALAQGPVANGYPAPLHRAEHAEAAGAGRQDPLARHVLREAHPGRARGADHRRGRRAADRVVDLGAVSRPRGHAARDRGPPLGRDGESDQRGRH